MDSTVMPSNYANGTEVRYGTHYVTLLSDKITYDSPIGKFSMSYATPNLNSESSYDKTTPRGNTSNVINGNASSLGLTKITVSNYIESSVPLHLFYIESLTIKPNTTKSDEYGVMSCNPQIEIKRKEYTKGQKFIATNVGGSLNQILILGVANE